jgi:DNA-binding GntR family transcriptional regulator
MKVGRQHFMKTLNRFVLTDEIYTILKEQVMSHALTPGEKINIDQMARELKVSNIPIREVLSRLVSEGLVRFVPFKGMFVTHMSLKELDEIFELRIELESLALRKAFSFLPCNELEIVRLQMDEWKVLGKQQGESVLQLISHMNDALHGLILRHCGNHNLQQLVMTYIERIQRYIAYIHQDIKSTVVMDEEWDEHLTIINEILRGNLESSVQALVNHLIKSHERTRPFFS